MTNKERFMHYAKQRLREKAFKQRRAAQEVIETHIEGYERCAKKRWRAGQR